MVAIEQIAHDLALVYVANQFGPEVSGDFQVSTSHCGNLDVSGSGSVTTSRMSNLSARKTERISTGEKRFGIFDKTIEVDAGEYAVDESMRAMIHTYEQAYWRFLALLRESE